MTPNKTSPIKRIIKFVIPWIDALALFTWGTLLLKYWSTGQIKLLIHPNYTWLVVCAGLILTVMGSLKIWPLVLNLVRRRQQKSNNSEEQHLSLFPPGVGSILLLAIAIVGLSVPPRALASDTALKRGVTETFSFTRSQPQSFRAAIKPEDRSLIDWVRTLNAYPEPDAYTAQKVNVKGFVVKSPELPDEYFLMSRFILTCCAVDAYPVGIPVKLETSRDEYNADQWLIIKGAMTTEELGEKRQLVIIPEEIKKIATPNDPYDY